MESEYTDSVYKEYKKNFGADWIDKLGWKDNTTRESSLQEGIQKMNSFLEFMRHNIVNLFFLEINLLMIQII